MPELPEVETVRRGLLSAMDGEIIKSVDVNRPDLRWPFPDKMKQRLDGQRIRGLRRRSKYILVDLDSGETLIIHLGMSGRMQVSGIEVAGFYREHSPAEKHDHVVFHMQNGARVTFNDPRRFGAMDIGDTATLENHKLLRVIGPEPFGNEFNETYLIEMLKTKTAPIKSALLDQRIVAGLGNIYVCEVLFRTGISPKKPAKSIGERKVKNLVPTIRDVLSEAIDAGGSSLQDHRQTDGQLGYFQHNFAVYDRENQPCLKAGCKGTIRRITQSGRSSFFCSQCQR